MQIVLIDDSVEIQNLIASQIKRKIDKEKLTDIKFLGFFSYRPAIEYVTFDKLKEDAIFLLDGDLGELSKTGLDIVKAMTDKQKSNTICISNNPVLREQIVQQGVSKCCFKETVVSMIL